jgi:Zn-dependent M28 family amino/carboxypeptidase
MIKKRLFVFLLWITFILPSFCHAASSDLEPYKKKSWGYLQQLVKFGPRYPESLGYEKTIALIREVGQKYADEVEEQKFNIKVPGREIVMRNMILKFKGTEEGRPIILGAHFDTRPFADQETDRILKQQPIVGANDGGSGTAILLSLAEYYKKHRPKRSVYLTFFDGEDYGAKGSGQVLLGSTYYANMLESLPEDQRPYCVLVIDMVGDRDLKIFKEAHSMESGNWLLDILYETAKEKKFSQFIPKSKYKIYDDHYPFARIGIPSVVLIDFDYPHWHKLTDTLDKCSPESLFAVLSVVVISLAQL